MMLPACRVPYFRCAYILPLAFLAFGLFLGVGNLMVAAPHYAPVGGVVVPGVDVWIAGKCATFVEVESGESATWWASQSRSLRWAGYVIAVLSVLWLVRNTRKANLARQSSELQIISK